MLNLFLKGISISYVLDVNLKLGEQLENMNRSLVST